jgi:hypothetical protein
VLIDASEADFVSRIAFDPLSAHVPAAHTAIFVEQIDRIVGHALNQEAKLLLT